MVSHETQIDPLNLIIMWSFFPFLIFLARELSTMSLFVRKNIFSPVHVLDPFRQRGGKFSSLMEYFHLNIGYCDGTEA